MLINAKPAGKIFAYLIGNNGLLACSLLPITTSAFGLRRVLLSYAHASRYLLTRGHNGNVFDHSSIFMC